MVSGIAGAAKSTHNVSIVNYLLKVREEYARQQQKDYSHVFKKKSYFDLMRLSCIIIGIQFAYAAETAFVSPILLELGVEYKHMTMVWALPPFLGFFMSPFLGSISDRCKLSIGRRRPLIIGLSMALLLGLLLVPHGEQIGVLLGDTGSDYSENKILNMTLNFSQFGTAQALHASKNFDIVSNCKFALIFTILGTILLDVSTDICQTPSRAYLLDVCIPNDHAVALSIFSTMAGVGASLGYALCGIDWESTSFGKYFGGNILTVFTLVTILFIICLVITITSFREIPLSLIEQDPMLKPLTASAIQKEVEEAKNDVVYYIREIKGISFQKRKSELSEYLGDSTISSGTYKKRDDEEFFDTNMKENLVAAMSSSFINENEEITENEETETKASLLEYLKSIIIMPKSMSILCLTNLLAWMAYLCYCLYFTDFVGEAVFGGIPSVNPESKSNLVYEEGVRFGCWGLTICAAACSIHSIFTEKLIKLFNLKRFYIGTMLIYVSGMFVLALWPTKIGVLVLSITSGMQYSTLLTVPYILVAKYHASNCFQVRRGEKILIKQARGLGTDVAIVSSMVFVAQLLISLGLGSTVSLLNTTAGVLYAASVFSLLASLTAYFVLYLE
ncbi:proton-associated sugar transporter A-like [Condylostylus longicornis]|uniref:proton-associated sugar transporter A-like n=1 Tax=Condylostylus longicornis TaxID=2530218 RepID=UPI00244E4C9D|nr:proton-associated sugar transporter A-like [Condylostylus longicornis]